MFELLAQLLGLSTAVACFLLWKDPQVRSVLTLPSRRSLRAHAGLVLLGVVVSLAAFDSFGSHAFRAHEDQMFDAFKGVLSDQMQSPLEVPVLARLVYGWLGKVLGFGANPLPAFVCVAIFFGAFGGFIAGLATEVLTRRPWAGWLLSLLLVFHPTLAYWRVHAYPIAFSHSLFCATLLAAAIVARAPTRRAFLAWFLLGALTTFFRIESAGPVLITALIPLLCGQHRMLLRVRIWFPSLLFAAALLAFPISEVYGLIVEREDYRTGLRFLGLHIGVLEVFSPLNSLALFPLLGIGALLVFMPHPDAAEARALCLAAAFGVFPSILFMDFGPRHVLPTTTMGLMLCVVVLNWLIQLPRLRSTSTAVCAGVLVLLSCLNCCGQLANLKTRYGANKVDAVATIPGMEPSLNPLPEEWMDCAVYSDVMEVCENHQNCHPIKDWRDPVLVARRWDRFRGCVLFGVDPRSDEVAGVQHETWPILRDLYPLEPYGRFPLKPRPEWQPYVDFYRLRTRPQAVFEE